MDSDSVIMAPSEEGEEDVAGEWKHAEGWDGQEAASRLSNTNLQVALSIVKMHMSDLFSIEVDYPTPAPSIAGDADGSQSSVDPREEALPRRTSLSLSDHMNAFVVFERSPRAREGTPGSRGSWMTDLESSGVEDDGPRLTMSPAMVGFSQDISDGGSTTPSIASSSRPPTRCPPALP